MEKIFGCDCCGAVIEGIRTDSEWQGYWTGPLGFHYCEACLAFQSDNFADMEGERRLWALRLRWVHGVNVNRIAEAVQVAARGGVEGRQQIDELLEDSFDLFRDGEKLVAMYAGIAAQNLTHLAWDIFQTAPLVERGVKSRSATRRGAAVKLANDPKQAAKAQAFELWKQWQAGLTLHRSGAAFARHIVNSLPIECTKTVERWMKQWRAAAAAK